MNIPRPQNIDPTPKIVKVLHEIGVRAKVREMKALEVFAGDGLSHVKDYITMVDTLDAWENNAKLFEEFKKNVPIANAKLCDSYVTVKSGLIQGKYDLVVVDNNLLQTDHIEHFDLFPDIFSILKPHGYLVLTVVLDPANYYLERKAFAKEPELLIEARNKFYNIPTKIQTDANLEKHLKLCFLQAYQDRAKYCNREVSWSYWEKRSTSNVYYLALEVRNE